MDDSTEPPADNDSPPPIPEDSGPTDPAAPLNPVSPKGLIETLLRHPLRLARQIESGEPVVGKLCLVALAALLLFGFVVGTFSMGTQLWAAPLKIALGTFFAAILCFPSLYIFSCLSGMNARLPTVAGLLAAGIALMSLLLVGFAPVVWIFSQSTNALGFIGALDLFIWILALIFGLGLILRAAKSLGARNSGTLVVWMGIFTLVTLQLTTSLRPVIGTSDKLITTEKRFFLQHWGETISETVVPEEQRYDEEEIDDIGDQGDIGDKRGRGRLTGDSRISPSIPFCSCQQSV